ncbi:hypothetical protein EC991_010288 [Linnemannia zychae]|nr:hypothetical protein EC991_010288 [Linnemannia zychae]
MPVQGYALSVQPPIIISQQQPQHHSYHQQQAPLQMQQAPRNTVPSVATPAAQPYYYQPGTGLVSVPVSIPPPEPYTPQPFQPVQAVTPAPSVPFAMNTAHYPTQPVSLLPPPPPPKQQQQQQIQQQQQVAYQPPPVTQATIATSAAAAAPRPSTPESGSIYLPGDSSRLLLSQGLYKIVPDAEDEEEAARAAAVSSSQTGPAPIISMDLNLGGDFLSSVLNYPNRQGPNNRNSNTFSSISQGTSSNPPTVANGVQVSGGPGAQGQTVRQQPGYHDRQAGHKDRPKNQPRFLVDKEEVITEERGQNGVNTSNGEPVIVGSDIVFEPLPSVKAARARDSLHGGLDSTGTSSSSLLNNNDTAKPNGGEKLKGAQGLARAPTIGAFLPTMGTEEYLERTDDKEEYSARLHGARDSATSPTPSTNVVHPTTRGELSKEAQGGIVDISSPIIPNTITPPSSDAVTMAAAVIPPRSSTPVSPPPLRLSTKPKFN